MASTLLVATTPVMGTAGTGQSKASLAGCMQYVNVCSWFILALLTPPLMAEYKPVEPRVPKDDEVAVTEPGSYARAGTTYVLTGDISSPRSAIFLGKDVTLDLNGHSITYADGGYEHVPNWSFEKGLEHWDTSKAPGAIVKDMRWSHPLVGEKVCVLPQGEEIVSEYVKLPVSDRAYYAMAAVAHHQMHVGIYVEDERGRNVECTFQWGNNSRPCCPEKRRGPKLGGGTVFALMFGKPAGKYRIRIKAVQRDCIIDAVDIRPAMDVGVSVVEQTMPWAYYKCILDGDGCAFFDYAKRDAPRTPVGSVPKVSGSGTIRIRNGIIRSGFRGIRSWGIQSTARNVRLDIENVKFEAAGINTNAVYAHYATMKDCRAEIDTPWIIDRHRQADYAISLVQSRTAPSKVSQCEFIGGQGQLAVRGAKSRIHDCLFVNKQTVVNHYSLGVGGRGTRVFRNRFLPEQGSGILIGREQGLDIFENEFQITASPPVNEYHNTDYSVSAIRLTDYNANRGNKRGWCGNNYIHHNSIRLVGRRYPQAHQGYKPMAYGIFMSVGGDQNYIHDNKVFVDQKDPPNSEKHGAYAFYIGGSNNGGTYYRNTITSNVTPVWIASMYGPGKNVTFYENAFIKAPDAPPFVPFRLGWWRNRSENVRFFSNKFEGIEFGVRINDYSSGFSSVFDVGWTLTVKTTANAEVSILNAEGQKVHKQNADGAGLLKMRLIQYKAQGQGQHLESGKRRVKIQRTDVSRYKVRAGDKEQVVRMDRDRSITLEQ